MLELRPNCELCHKDLPPDSLEARICSYECTYCADCVEPCFSMSAQPAEEASAPGRSAPKILGGQIPSSVCRCTLPRKRGAFQNLRGLKLKKWSKSCALLTPRNANALCRGRITFF